MIDRATLAQTARDVAGGGDVVRLETLAGGRFRATVAGPRGRWLVALDPLLGTAVIQWAHARDACHARTRDHRARVLGPARPRAPGRRADHGLRARGRRPRRPRPAVARLPAGRARAARRRGRRGTRAARAGWTGRCRTSACCMLDQRGTGRSTPVGTLPGHEPAEQADYLTHFRADAIVRDAERIRARAGRRAAGACSARASAASAR